MPTKRFKHSEDKNKQRTAVYYMTVLCCAGCFCYYSSNDTQWTGAGACSTRLQLKEWITAVRMKPKSSSLFHNLKISWGFGVSGKPNPSREGAATAARSMLFLSSYVWLFYKDQTPPFQQRICPISKQNQLGVVILTTHKDPVKGSGEGKGGAGVGDLASHEPSFPPLIKRKVGCSSLPTCTSSTYCRDGSWVDWGSFQGSITATECLNRVCWVMFEGRTGPPEPQPRRVSQDTHITVYVIVLLSGRVSHSHTHSHTWMNIKPPL